MNLESFRRQMPVTRSWAYMDHAAVSPLPEPARAALAEWADDVAANGLVHINRWAARIEEIRNQFGRLLNADPLDVAFVKNTSEGVGIPISIGSGSPGPRSMLRRAAASSISSSATRPSATAPSHRSRNPSLALRRL